jgi:arginase
MRPLPSVRSRARKAVSATNWHHRGVLSRILVPYRIDKPLPETDWPMSAETVIACAVDEPDPWSFLAELNRAVRDAVAERVTGATVPLVLCGDCTTSIGTVAGLQRAGLDPAVVWFDAHGDVQTLETTASGFLGGMPLRVLVGYRPELIGTRLGLRPVPEDRVVLVDARDLDPPEVEYLSQADIRHVTVADVSTMELPAGPIYLHVDIDVVSSDVLPGLWYPAPNGPDLAEVFQAIRAVLSTGRVAAIGFACTWNPGQNAAALVRPHLEAALADHM